MRKIFYIFLFLLLFSCSNSKNEQLYIEYIEQFRLMTALSDTIIERNVNHLTYLMNDLTRNPYIFKIWMDEINIVKSKSDSVFNEIEDIKIRILSDQNVTRFKLGGIKNSRNRISKKERNNLEENIKVYEKLLTGKLKGYKYQRVLKENIQKLFDVDILFEQSILKGKKCSSLELYALLTMIQYNIKTVEADMTHFFLSRIGEQGYRFTKLVALVDPEVKTILKGEEYKAEIFLSATDTTITPRIIVGKQKLNFYQGKAIYKKLISLQDTGKITETGKIFTTRGYGDDTTNIPFEIEYQVIKQ